MLPLQQEVINNLTNAKVLFFPDYNGSGHQYLEVKSVALQPEPYNLWATVQTNAGELIVTSSCDIDNMLDYFLQTNQNKTVLRYIINDRMCPVHTSLDRLTQYGEYRTKGGMQSEVSSIFYPMVNGNDDRIPF